MLGLPLYIALPALAVFWLGLALLLAGVVGTCIDVAEHWDDDEMPARPAHKGGMT